MSEGYVLHSYGHEHYLHQAVASVATLRRYDPARPVALFSVPGHIQALRDAGLDTLFDIVDELPEAHRSIVGFKHHLERFMPFDASLFVDADMVWCRDPDPLWRQLSAFGFTATGLERADFWFGGPKGAGIVLDWVLDRRRRTMRRFGLTYLPRVQAGMIYASSRDTTAAVTARARDFLARRSETHFRSRLDEGRTEESCEWSLAMAMSALQLPVVPWFQAQNSPQLDYVPGLVDHDRDFETVRCLYYTSRRVMALRGIKWPSVRNALVSIATRLPGRGDSMIVTPYTLHFGWLRFKQPYLDLASRTWERLAGGAHVDGIESARHAAVGT